MLINRGIIFMAAGLIGLFAGTAQAEKVAKPLTTKHVNEVAIGQIRNATLKINYAGTTFLVDPMLAKKGAYPAFAGTYRSELRNPLVELPSAIPEIIKGVDAVIVTHTHPDHWDEAAQAALPKHLPLFVQNEQDAQLIRSQGFTKVTVVGKETVFNNIHLTKIGGQHGTDTMYAIPSLATRLGDAMGVVLQAKDNKTLYIAGDTIWRKEVTEAISNYQPDIIILNTGYAQFKDFEGSIIMGKDDVKQAYQIAPNALIIATHMDALNHCMLTRKALTNFIQQEKIEDRVLIPEDGEVILQ